MLPLWISPKINKWKAQLQKRHYSCKLRDMQENSVWWSVWWNNHTLPCFVFTGWKRWVRSVRSRGQRQSVSFVNRRRGRWSPDWQLYTEKHSEHRHPHRMSGLHLHQGLQCLLLRMQGREVSESGHWREGGVCQCICAVGIYLQA